MGPAVLEYAEEAGKEHAPLCSGEAEPEPEPRDAAELLLVVCRFLGVWYSEVSSDHYAGKLCRAIPALCGNGPQWGGHDECRLHGLARLLPALAPLASRPHVADALLAAGCIPHAARLLQQVLPTHPPTPRLAHPRRIVPRVPAAHACRACRRRHERLESNGVLAESALRRTRWPALEESAASVPLLRLFAG